MPDAQAVHDIYGVELDVDDEELDEDDEELDEDDVMAAILVAVYNERPSICKGVRYGLMHSSD